MIPHLGYLIDPDAGFAYGKRGRKIQKMSQRYIRAERRGFGRFVHVMVWEAVNGPIPDGMQINHKNGVRTDNRLSNRELVTPSENTLHAYRLRLRSAVGEKNGRAILTEEAVREIRASNVPASQLARVYGVSKRTVCDARNGSSWGSVA